MPFALWRLALQLRSHRNDPFVHYMQLIVKAVDFLPQHQDALRGVFARWDVGTWPVEPV